MTTVAVHRDTVATIDLNAVYKNIQTCIQAIEPGQEVYATIKANGYGHGMLAVAQTALEAGVTGFCVAVIDEALELIRAGWTVPILVLGNSRVEDVTLAGNTPIRLTVSSLEWVRQAYPLLKASRKKVYIHLACDTGMGRIGLQTVEELTAIEDFVRQHEDVFVLEGMFTHFATADEENEEYLTKQRRRFAQFVNALERPLKYIHCSNSAFALWHHAETSAIVRYGIAIYGINPSNDTLALTQPLVPAMRLDTKIIHIKQMNEGDCIGYGATYTCSQGEWIATLPIGYADGWLRSYSGMDVLVEGMRCKIVGRICMDQCMISLPTYVPIGTRVTLIGENGGDFISAVDVARHAHTIAYEVVCSISNRVPRIYKEREK